MSRSTEGRRRLWFGSAGGRPRRSGEVASEVGGRQLFLGHEADRAALPGEHVRRRESVRGSEQDARPSAPRGHPSHDITPVDVTQVDVEKNAIRSQTPNCSHRLLVIGGVPCHLKTSSEQELARRLPERRIVVHNEYRRHHGISVTDRPATGNRANPTRGLGSARTQD